MTIQQEDRYIRILLIASPILGALLITHIVASHPRQSVASGLSASSGSDAPAFVFRDPRNANPSTPAGKMALEGARLFVSMGCASCHGDGGKGGVKNLNYIAGTVPALDVMAERMFLYDEEDADGVVELLLAGADLDEVAKRPPFPRFGSTVAQIKAVRTLIKIGNPAGKKDPDGPWPPLQMPAWENRLTDRQIDAILVYLIREFDWEEEEDEEEEEEPPATAEAAAPRPEQAVATP